MQFRSDGLTEHADFANKRVRACCGCCLQVAASRHSDPESARATPTSQGWLLMSTAHALGSTQEQIMRCAGRCKPSAHRADRHDAGRCAHVWPQQARQQERRRASRTCVLLRPPAWGGALKIVLSLETDRTPQEWRTTMPGPASSCAQRCRHPPATRGHPPPAGPYRSISHQLGSPHDALEAGDCLDTHGPRPVGVPSTAAAQSFAASA